MTQIIGGCSKQQQYGSSAPALTTMDPAFLCGLAMAPNEDDKGAAGIIRDAMPQIAAATCVVMIGTCLNMWSTQQLIQQSIRNIVQSDQDQTFKIERLRDDVNTLRVEHGILRGRLIDVGRRVGAP